MHGLKRQPANIFTFNEGQVSLEILCTINKIMKIDFVAFGLHGFVSINNMCVSVDCKVSG